VLDHLLAARYKQLEVLTEIAAFLRERLSDTPRQLQTAFLEVFQFLPLPAPSQLRSTAKQF
jgi:hypothetical protein